MSKNNKIRLVILIPTFILGYLIVSTLYLCWTSFILAEDSTQTDASIVSVLSHGVVQYKYAVGNKEFVGQSQPSRNQPVEVQAGATVRVNYCPHRPWLSSLQDPAFPPSQVLMLLFVLPFEFFCIATLVNPKGKWALQIRVD